VRIGPLFVEMMFPFMCGDLNWQLRQRVTLPEDGVVKTNKECCGENAAGMHGEERRRLRNAAARTPQECTGKNADESAGVVTTVATADGEAF
jgi:hypothetical protein